MKRDSSKYLISRHKTPRLHPNVDIATGKEPYKVILETIWIGCYYIFRKLSWKKGMIKVNKINFNYTTATFVCV